MMGPATPPPAGGARDAVFDRVQKLYRACLFHAACCSTADDLSALELDLAGRFAAENAMMDRIGFADAERHRAAHDAILRALAALRRALAAGLPGAFRAQMPELALLILEHRMRDDRALAEHQRRCLGPDAVPPGTLVH